MRTRAYRGFTMIELIVAMAIIAVLGGIFMPNLRRAVQKSEVGACQSNMRNIAVSIIQYSNDNDKFYPNTLAVCVPQWLKAIPTCPSAHSDTYTPGYEIMMGANADFTISCKGTNHPWVGFGQDEPWYNVTKGLGPSQ